MAGSAAQAAALIGAIKAHWLVCYMAMACTTFLVLDYIQTLPAEIKTMWRAKRSPMKVLFIFVRYYPFIHTTCTALYYDNLGMSRAGPNACRVRFLMAAFSSILVYWICDAVAFVRVYAFGGREKILAVFLILWYLGLRVVEFVLMWKFTSTARFLPGLREARLGCIPAGRSANTHLLSWVFIAVLVNLFVISAIMVYFAYRRRQDTQVLGGLSAPTSLINIFLRDGIMYFISLLTLSLANIIFDRTAPQNGTQYALLQLHVHANAILTGRMLIQLRMFAMRDTEQTPSGRVFLRTRVTVVADPSALEFAPYDSKTVPPTLLLGSPDTEGTATFSTRTLTDS